MASGTVYPTPQQKGRPIMGTVRSSLGRFGMVTTSAMQAINQHPNGTPTVLAVYVALTTHADRDGEQAWRCSVNSIAEEAGVSARSVRTAKSVLVDLGLLELTANWNGDERQWDSYLINYLPATAATGHAPDAGGPASDARGGPAQVAGLRTDQEEQTNEQSSLPIPVECGDERGTTVRLFNRWWEQYPRKVAKKDAQKAWKAMSVADRRSALAALDSHISYWDAAGRGSETIPYPATWLRRESWHDELAPIRAARADTRQSRTADAAAEFLATQIPNERQITS